MSSAFYIAPKTCANHEGSPAIAVCSLCGRPICGHCHMTSLVGYAVCKACPVLEKLKPKTMWERSHGLTAVRGFLYTVVEFITGPRTFFLKYPQGNVWDGLIFGYLCLTIALGASRIWGYFFLGRFQAALSDVASQAGISFHTATWLYFGLTPLSSAIALMSYLATLYVGLRFVGAKNVTLPTVSWIASMSTASLLFQILPPIWGFSVGQLLGMFWLMNVLFVVGKVRFELSTARALAGALVPFWVLTTLAQ